MNPKSFHKMSEGQERREERVGFILYEEPVPRDEPVPGDIVVRHRHGKGTASSYDLAIEGGAVQASVCLGFFELADLHNAIGTLLAEARADMNRIDAAMQARRLVSRMILQVHDELIFECPAEEGA